MQSTADRLVQLGLPAALAIELAKQDDLPEPLSGSERRFMLCFDQNPPNTATFKANILALERTPFDGHAIEPECTHPVLGSTSLSNVIWTSNAITWPNVQTALDNLLTTDCIKAQHNFLVARVTPPTALGEPPLDWFDPCIETAIHNFRMLSRLSFEGKCRGIWLDLEPDNSTSSWKLFNFSDRPGADSDDVERDIDAYKERIKYIGKRVIEVFGEEHPNGHLLLSFCYEQATLEPNVAEASRNYGLLPSFLHGIFDAAKASIEIHDWHEAGYALYTETQLKNAKRAIESPSPRSKRYKIVRGNATRPDQLDADYIYTAMVNGAELLSERYLSCYQEDELFQVDPPTMASDKIAALEMARVSLGLDSEFDPVLVPGLLVDFNPFLLSGLANDDPISSVTTATGNTYTQSGSARPIYKANGFGSGIPAISFTAASSQHLICDAVAALLTAAGSQDFPYTIIAVQQLSAASGATFCTASFGQLSTPNSQIRCQVTSSSKYQFQRLDDSGTAAPLTEGTGTADTDPHIVAWVSDGIHGSIRVDGAQIITKGAQDVGVMTMNQHAIGASRGNITTAYFGGLIGRVLIYKWALGIGQLRYLERGLGAQFGVTVT